MSAVPEATSAAPIEITEPVVIDYDSIKKVEKYDVVVLHTPWSAMEQADLEKIPVNDITSDNSTLYMYTDSANMSKSIHLIEKYGFTYKSVAAIVDIAEKPVEVPEPAAVEPESTAPVEEATQDEKMVVEPEEPEQPVAKKTSKNTVKRARIKSIHPFKWWGDKHNNDMSRVTTEQLLIAYKGNGAAVSPKYKVQQFQVINLPELSKNKSKARSITSGNAEWNFKRSDAVFDMVLSTYAKTPARIIDMFSGNIHADAASFSVNNPTQFVSALSGDEEHVGEGKEVLETMGKVALKSLSAKFRKALTVDDDEKVDSTVKSLLADMGEEWKSDEMKRLMSILVDYTLNSRPVRVKKAKRVKTELDANRPRYGIEAPSKISKELCDVLGLPHGSMIARTDMNRELNQYIEKNNLKDGKIVIMDERLSKLQRANDTEPVDFFTLCYKISPHFEAKITPDLQAFLKLDEPKVPLIEAEQALDAYVKKNGLYNADGVTVIPDDALKALFDTQEPIKDMSVALQTKFIKKNKSKRKKNSSGDSSQAVKKSKIDVVA
jgi:chromatin remodeling complex protein RSC6